MNQWQKRIARSCKTTGLVLAGSALMMLTACGPDYSRITDDLRTHNMQLEKDLAASQRQLRDRDTEIHELKEKQGPTTRVARLADDQLAKMFTVDRVEIRKNTDIWDFDSDGKPDGYRVYVRTFSDGQTLPATGDLKIEAFDLADTRDEIKLGTWYFTPEELKKNWLDTFGFDCFGLNCPWQSPPQHREITFKIVFTDTLTGRMLSDQVAIKVRLK